MKLEKDEIVGIPDNRVKFFGGTGKMLLPSISTVAGALNKVPIRKLVTIRLLSQELSRQFDVQGTCPVTIKKAIVSLAKDNSKKTPYWRVINQNGGLISQFPGGVERQAAYLREEGFIIESSGKTKKVKNFKENLVHA